MSILEVAKENILKKEQKLSPYATLSKEALRFQEESSFDIRSPFFKDIDRIIYSLSYYRYIDKTQVFSLVENEHISKRIIHVQLVSKIARTIGRALDLNEDLIEAIALGHDVGHVPFGHVGEAYLSEISEREEEGYFHHNVQSVRTLMYLEKHGHGNNLCLQTLDGILCHNGEIPSQEYYPREKTKEQFLEEYERTYREKNATATLVPMTLEGCVVRISDIIGYIGRDIEDAIRLDIIKIEELPREISDILGSDNRSIINTIILDIIQNSYGKPYIKLSDSIYQAICALKDFNYKHIYDKANSKERKEEYRQMFQFLYTSILKDLEENNTQSRIYQVFLKEMTEEYQRNTSNKRIVIDYIAGMTDDYFLKEYHIYKNQ